MLDWSAGLESLEWSHWNGVTGMECTGHRNFILGGKLTDHVDLIIGNILGGGGVKLGQFGGIS